MNFSKIDCQNFRNEINAALAAVAAKHGVSIKADGAKYTNSTIEFKLNVAKISDGGKVVTKESLALPGAIAAHGLAVGAADKTFVVQGLTLKLSGYNARCYAKPWLASDNFGKEWKLSRSTVEQKIGFKPCMITNLTPRGMNKIMDADLAQ
jgi:hypothetical protein